MGEYNKINVKLSDSELNKLKSSVINQTGATLRMNIKMFEGNNLPYELLLTTRQKTKLRNAYVKETTCQLIKSCLKLKYLK